MDNAIEVPDWSGVRIEHAIVVWLDSDPCIQSVVNGEGRMINDWQMTINLCGGGKVY